MTKYFILLLFIAILFSNYTDAGLIERDRNLEKVVVREARSSYEKLSIIRNIEYTVYVSSKSKVSYENIEEIGKYILIGDSSRHAMKFIIENSNRLFLKINIGNSKSIYYVQLNSDQLDKIYRSGYIDIVLEDSLFINSLINEYFKTNYLIKRFNKEHISFNKTSLNYYDYLPSLDLIQVPFVWNNYGVFGENVVIGIVDTGVDFANPDLGLESIARDIHGNPLILAIDNGLIIFTNVSSRIGDKLITENTVIKVFDPINRSVYNVVLDYNLTIGSINSLTGVYKVGLLPFYTVLSYLSNSSRLILVKTFVLALMVDEEIPGIYNRVYFDLSTAFYELSKTIREIEREIIGTPVWREPLPTWFDHSIVDEYSYKPGYEIVARDFDNDGYYDFSLGTIAGYYLDTIGLLNGTPGYYVGWDYNGRYLAIMFDYFGHGTNVATIIAGRGSNTYSGYNGLFRVKGVAPQSKIATGSVLWSFETIILEAWLCGYTPYFRRIGDMYYIEFNYYGPRRADIVNNSWNYMNIIRDLQNIPGLDVLTYLFDSIVFNRTFIVREPVIIVFSSGNSGPGFTSIHSPGSGLLTITVGASTWFKPMVDYGFNGLYDEVVSFSSRGPSGQGYPKPDLVSNGFFEYASTRVLDGFGYGSTINLFAGTSLSAPYTTGALALILSLFRNIYGLNYSLDTFRARILLKNSCDDLGYTPFVQGSGRLNVLKTVERILFNKPIVYTIDGLTQAFIENYYSVYGDLTYNISQYFLDTCYYAIVKPGESRNFTLYITNYTGFIKLHSRELYFYKETIVYDNVFDYRNPLLIKIPEYSYAYSDYVEIIILLENLTYPIYMFGRTPVDDKHSLTIYLFDWRDLNRDNVVDNFEKYFISIDSRIGVETFLSIAKPDEKIIGKLYLQLEPSEYDDVKTVDLKITVRAYKFRESNMLIYPEEIFVENFTALNIVVNVSKNTIPGVYETAILIEYDDDRILVPVSILVPLVLDNLSTVLIGLEYSDLRYYSFRLRGLYDVYSSYECSDWRMLPVLVNDPSISGVLFVARWSSGYSTDLTLAITPPGGVFNNIGSINIFSTYKLTNGIGFVYNSNLDDQVNNRLKTYLPIKWNIASRLSDIYGLYVIRNGNLVNSFPYLIYPGEYVRRDSEIYGLYRVFYSFNSYSGRIVEDQISFRIIMIRSRIEVESEQDYNGFKQYVLKYEFQAGAYTPFYMSKVYVISNNTITVPGYDLIAIPIALYNQRILITGSGYDLGIVYASRFLNGTVFVQSIESIVLEISIVLWIIDYPIRCEGFYYYSEYYGELIIHDIVYPGVVTSQFVANVPRS
ncbi:MAG: S8 family serine peptidase [Desulfurococcaceae archaeon]